MIPKLIHQTAKTREIPRQWQKYQQTLQELHPDWTYRLWTDEDNLAFVQKEFPEYLETFVKLPKNIMRADMIRYFLLHRLGGLYMDLDYEMLRPFDLLDYEVVLPWERDNVCLSNAFMAASPGNRFFKLVIDELRANPPLQADVAEVEASTGPKFLTKLLPRAQAEGMSVYVPTETLFSPPTPRSPRQYRKIVEAGTAYGIHHCYGTWREHSLTRKIRNGAVTAYKWLFT
jgi:inositol phosphorylceramide mannosyltransferase catalytic subunit